MIRYNMKFGGLTVSASAVSQMQYNNFGIDAAEFSVTANQAKRNGVVPELVLSGEWTKNSITLGAGVEYNRIKPRMMITETLVDGVDVSAIADEFLNSAAFMGYSRYKKDKLTILLKGFYGDNMQHLTLPGGYGVSTFDAATGKETYTNYTTYTTSLSMVYGQKWQLGLFAGYGGNIGTKDPLFDSGSGKAKTYGLFTTMQNMKRVAPHISLNLPKFRLVAEYEMTATDYGTGNINLANGLYSSSQTATNNRVIIVMTHYF